MGAHILLGGLSPCLNGRVIVQFYLPYGGSKPYYYNGAIDGRSLASFAFLQLASHSQLITMSSVQEVRSVLKLRIPTIFACTPDQQDESWMQVMPPPAWLAEFNEYFTVARFVKKRRRYCLVL